MDTTELIASLSREAAPEEHLRPPRYFAARLIWVLLAYGTVIQFFLGLRPDLATQFTRPLFALEIALLALLILMSTTAALFAMYPDAYQKQELLMLPYAIFVALAALIFIQWLVPPDTHMFVPLEETHNVQCALCIASVAIVPSALLFVLLRKGATVHPFMAGSFAVLASTGIGCLTLRLAEANDALLHLTSWHYLPTLVFATLGAIAGKFILKW